MIAFHDSKITIIGFGFLMGYIFPCIADALKERVSTNVNAVTADEAQVSEKSAQFGIQVYYKDNMKALTDMHPDYIFFAPPPVVAAELIETCLKPYFDRVRAEKGELPGLLAFPPSPHAEFYKSILGDDIRVVNIIPNMLTSINGERVNSDKRHLFTFPEPDNWSREEKQELADFFAPMGRAMEVPRARVMHILSAEIMTHPLTEFAYDASNALNGMSISVSSEQCAATLRYLHAANRAYVSKLGSVSDPNMIPTRYVQVLETLYGTWFETIKDHLLGLGLTASEAVEFLNPLFDLYFCEAERETREMIIAKARKDATKGGMLELCMNGYAKILRPVIAKAIKGKVSIHSSMTLFRKYIETIIGAVAEKGNKLAGGVGTAFHPADHALLFSSIAEAAFSMLGKETAEAYIQYAVTAYGMERGKRMAGYAKENGDALDMASYFAYTEMNTVDGFVKESLPGTRWNAYVVRQCPWCTAWEKADKLQVGAYYCDWVDTAILRGFSDKLRLSITQTLSRTDGCMFNWLDSKNDVAESERVERIKSRIESTYLRGFDFHCAHLLYSAMRSLNEYGGDGAELLARSADRYLNFYSNSKLLQILLQMDFFEEVEGPNYDTINA